MPSLLLHIVYLQVMQSANSIYKKKILKFNTPSSLSKFPLPPALMEVVLLFKDFVHSEGYLSPSPWDI